MTEKLIRIEERFRTVKNLDELKRDLASFCRAIAEYFELEMCIVIFHESNPILSPFAVSYPPSDYEKAGENDIDGIEPSLAKTKKMLFPIPILHKSDKTGSIILVRNPGTARKEIDIDRLEQSAAKISEIIKKFIGLEIKVRLTQIIQRLISYKKKIGSGQEKSHRIILDLLSFLFLPTRVYIAVQIDDGSYVFYHVTAECGKIADISHGVFKESQFEFLMIDIDRDEPWTAEIDIKDHGRIRGKMMVRYEKCGSFVDDDIQKILKAIGSNFADLVLFNYFGKKPGGFGYVPVVRPPGKEKLKRKN